MCCRFCARRICLVSALGRSSFASVDSLVPRRAFRLLPFRRKAAQRFANPLDARTRPNALTLHACGLLHAPSRATLLTAPVLLLLRFPSLRGLPHAPSHTNAGIPCARFATLARNHPHRRTKKFPTVECRGRRQACNLRAFEKSAY